MAMDPLEELTQSIDPTILENPPKMNPQFFVEGKWVSQHRKELEAYEGKWIAVHEKKLLAYGEDGDQVRKEALQKIGHEVQNLYMEFLELGHCIY